MSTQDEVVQRSLNSEKTGLSPVWEVTSKEPGDVTIKDRWPHPLDCMQVHLSGEAFVAPLYSQTFSTLPD